jgi:hypothetical protein
MSSASRLGKQIEEVVATLGRLGVPFALIGGLALASHKVVRATQDVDLLTEANRADEIDKALVKLGYHIRALLRANRNAINMDEVREYFAVFDRQSMLDEMLNEIG